MRGQLIAYNIQMFGFTFPQILYYPVPSPFVGFQAAPNFVMPIYPQIQHTGEMRAVEMEELGNSKGKRQTNTMTKFQSSASEKESPEPISRSSRAKKIKGVQKSPPRTSKKYLFKNSYLSFAAHKLLTFIGNRGQSERIVRILTRKWKVSEEEAEKAIKLFYNEHNNVMKYIVNNASIRKLRELWTGEFIGKFSGKLKKAQSQFYAYLYRTLSKIYFEEHYCSFLLRSKKVRKLTVAIHLKMRKYLLLNLRNPQNFVCYQGFD